MHFSPFEVLQHLRQNCSKSPEAASRYLLVYGALFITIPGLNTLTSHRHAAIAVAEHMRSLAAGAFAVAFRPGAMRYVQASAKGASACL